MFGRKSALIFSFLLLWLKPSFAQEGTSYKLPQESNVDDLLGLGARAMGMGSAHIAVAEDFSALWWNPAGLARIRRIELSGGLIHQKEKSRSLLFGYGKPKRDSHTRLGSGGIAIPLPTYRGSLVFAFGLNRIQNFDSSLKFEGGILEKDLWEEGFELKSGGLHTWGLGGAIDLSPFLSAGATIMFWRGEENYTWNLVKDTLNGQGRFLRVTNWDYFQDDYSGINLKLGLLLRANRYITLGGTLESPLTLTVEQDWTSQTDSLFSDSTISSDDYGYYKYKLSHPYKFGLGARLTLPYLILAADLSYTDWSQTEYKYPPQDVSDLNPYMSDAYRDVLGWHIGAETLVPKAGLKVRLGYYRDPIPYKLKRIKNSRDYLTFGFGFLIGREMTLDVALVHGLWETSSGSLDERYSLNRVFITAAYRF
jgi:long-subunit fatty acid transport protein